ncbi:MAG: hypothetical protein RSC93_01855 [Erysipelotrichaceae bacterium]
MSKFKIKVTYDNDAKLFESNSLDECNKFLSNLSNKRKFDDLELSYVLDVQKHTYKVIDKITKETLKVIPKEVGTGMMFSLQSILMRNNQL